MKSETLGDREALHKAIYHCTRCRELGYPVERIQPQWDPAKGHGSMSKWGMLIGQAPGIDELKRAREVEGRKPINQPTHGGGRTGIAFQGRTGQRLRHWLTSAGFTEEQIRTLFLKTSVTKCFPGRVKGNQDRKPTKKEIELCSPFLREQIRLVDPSVLIPTGQVAINWFFPGVKRLEEVIGEERQWAEDGQAYTVICLPHASPASAWWKAESNKPLLEKAQQLLSELREASLP